MARKKQETIINESKEFSKKQIVSSKRYINHKDLLNAILEDSEKYTLEQVEEKIKEFKKGKV